MMMMMMIRNDDKKTVMIYSIIKDTHMLKNLIT